MSTPDYLSHDEYILRNQKLKEIRELGIEPFVHRYQPTTTASDIQRAYEQSPIGTSEQAEKDETDLVKIGGRLVLFRAMGKNAFAHLQEGDAKIQVMFNRDLTQVEGLAPDAPITAIKFIEKKIDLGDILGVEGHLFRTHKGEITIFAKRVTLLTKSLLPLPEKHSGLVDKEMRYRKRWLDLISHEEVRKVFVFRSKLIHQIRHFLHNEKFFEVETPVLQNSYGGAAARPFTTHLHALDQEMYLRISPEISLKKLIVGGMERVFEIGKVFRNEGIDRTHNPEFTIVEAYATYLDYNDLMALVERLVEECALALLGTTKIALDEETTIDVKAPWKKMTMKGSILEVAGIDVDTLTDADIKRLLQDTVDPKQLANAPRGLLIATLFDEKVVDKLIQPTHIIDHPIETTPLCKPHREKKEREEGLVERFESFVGGKELCNAYTELNDPILQRELLEQQVKKREMGDLEAHPLDEEFIEAVCQGLPPTGGFGIGIDRLIMLLTNSQTIRDVIYFPLMKTH